MGKRIVTFVEKEMKRQKVGEFRKSTFLLGHDFVLKKKEKEKENKSYSYYVLVE